MLFFHSYWVQRITANIPSLYIRSMIQGKWELVGRIEIWHGPRLNFLEEAGQRQILQGIFECCELLCSSPYPSPNSPTATQNSRKREGTRVENDKGDGRREATKEGRRQKGEGRREKGYVITNRLWKRNADFDAESYHDSRIIQNHHSAPHACTDLDRFLPY